MLTAGLSWVAWPEGPPRSTGRRATSWAAAAMCVVAIGSATWNGLHAGPPRRDRPGSGGVCGHRQVDRHKGEPGDDHWGGMVLEELGDRHGVRRLLRRGPEPQSVPVRPLDLGPARGGRRARRRSPPVPHARDPRRARPAGGLRGSGAVSYAGRGSHWLRPQDSRSACPS